MSQGRDFLIHYARVQLAQARHFREREQRLGWDSGYSASLLAAAGRARRDAMACCPAPAPAQGELFA